MKTIVYTLPGLSSYSALLALLMDSPDIPLCQAAASLALVAFTHSTDTQPVTFTSSPLRPPTPRALSSLGWFQVHSGIPLPDRSFRRCHAWACPCPVPPHPHPCTHPALLHSLDFPTWTSAPRLPISRPPDHTGHHHSLSLASILNCFAPLSFRPAHPAKLEPGICTGTCLLRPAPASALRWRKSYTEDVCCPQSQLLSTAPLLSIHPKLSIFPQQVMNQRLRDRPRIPPPASDQAVEL
ncbi:uncharacterized protein LOC120602789 [Pteropus medius]|uniref:uncharacterized protein LOC120602789 n=1 Tax=Pteropus vampyrus TaxID=132908 RepID=UPI00196BB0C4|nr:uncharacterized protein LOC120602789 [Pteropus giganteus]